MRTETHPEYFLTIAEEKSFSKASSKLFVSQPYLSQYISNTEKELKVKLLNRNVVPLELTEAGQIYKNYLESQIKLGKKLERDLDEQLTMKSQVLNIGFTSWRAGTLLPDILPTFCKENPSIKTNFYEYMTYELYSLVNEDKIDLAILNMPLDFPDNMIAETICYERIFLACNKNNPLTQKLIEKLDLDLIRNERFLLMRPEVYISKRIQNYLDKNNINLTNIIRCSNTQTALSLVSDDFGFCFVNETGIDKVPKRENFIFFDFKTPDMMHPLCALYKKNSYLLPSARKFINTAIDFYASHNFEADY